MRRRVSIHPSSRILRVALIWKCTLESGIEFKDPSYTLDYVPVINQIVSTNTNIFSDKEIQITNDQSRTT